MGKPRMMFYHDGRHSHIYRYEPPMAPEEYTAMVDELAGTPVDAIMLCLGEGRTMLHDTRAGELWGHNVDKWDPQGHRQPGVPARPSQRAGADRPRARPAADRVRPRP